MEYVPGRKYSKNHVPKGKSKSSKPYMREGRDSRGVPASRGQLLQFIKDQNRELNNFIQETDERRFVSSVSVQDEEDDEDSESEEKQLEEADGPDEVMGDNEDGDEELLMETEWEI